MPSEAHRRPLLLGHRGCRLRAFPENSVAAFSHALQSGADGFEFDVRLTADGKLVCLHDEHLGQVPVATSTYSQLLAEYIHKFAFSGEGALVCLPEVLDAFRSKAFLNIELKVAGMEHAVLTLLRDRPPEHGCFVSSFLPEVICGLAELAASELGRSVELGYVFDSVSGLHAWQNLPGPWVVPRHDLVTRELVESVHGAGRKLATWTINRPSEMVRLAGWGVDALVSDDPALLSRTVLALGH